MRIQQFRKILLSSLTVAASAAVLVFILKLYFSPEPMAQYLESGFTHHISPLLSPKFDRAPYDNDQKRHTHVSDLIQAREKEERPNIVLVLAQGMGYGDMGCYGNPLIPTPNMDDLAHRGARFTAFYTANTAPSPARAALMTGRYAHRTGITFTLYPEQDPRFLRQAIRNMEQAIARIGALEHPADLSILNGLPPSEITLARALKQAGYRTGLFGKWDLGDFTANPAHHPREHGFDTFCGFNTSSGDWPVAYWEDNTQLLDDIRNAKGPSIGELTDKALAFMGSVDVPSSQAPFFIIFSPMMEPGQAIDLQPTPAGAYGSRIMALDQTVGRIQARLKQLGRGENTLILVTSDTGPVDMGRTLPHRGRTGDGYEGGFRIPFIVCWPRGIPASQIVDAPAMNTDIFPTLAAVAGIDPPRDRILDGRDISSLWTHNVPGLSQRDLFYFHGNDLMGIRSGEMKYLRHPRPALFHLIRDPGEAYNLFQDRPQPAQYLEGRLQKWEGRLYLNSRGWLE